MLTRIRRARRSGRHWSSNKILVVFCILIIIYGLLNLADLREIQHTYKSNSNSGSTYANNIATQPAWLQDFTKLPAGNLDPHSWQFDLGSSNGWGNNELQYYTDHIDNAHIQNGQLILQAQKEMFGGSDYTSSRITTYGTLDFTYGKIDITAKLPKGDGSRSAIWMLASDNKYAIPGRLGDADPNNWLRDGEINIAEAVGSEPGVISASAHSYKFNPNNHNDRTQSILIRNNPSDFHTYSLIWTPTKLIFEVDSKPYYTVLKGNNSDANSWPYDQKYHLLIDVAIGGTWGGEKKDIYPPNGVNDKSGPWKMIIKSVAYYPYLGQ